ncbi:MAG: bile acid:sodium symporter family protein [Woeseiaceae bacterium]|nr:bile acid:sodium symporter family protein [Woeseiaceae bacterium]
MQLVDFAFTRLVPPMLFVMMFGMGLSLTLADFRRIVRYPRAVLVGLAGQLLLLPVLAFGLILLFEPPAPVAVGGMLLAACPGGITSNGYAFVARGDVGLSVTLTAIASVLTIATIPLIVWFALDFFSGAGDAPALPAAAVLKALVLLTALPVALGMLVRRRFPAWAERNLDNMRRASFVLLLAIITTTTLSSLDSLAANLPAAGLLAATLNLSAMTAGYLLGRGFRLPPTQVRSVTFEVGVQNLSLAAVLAVSVLGRPDYAILAIVYALMMKLSALSLLWLWRRPAAAPA